MAVPAHAVPVLRGRFAAELRLHRGGRGRPAHRLLRRLQGLSQDVRRHGERAAAPRRLELAPSRSPRARPRTEPARDLALRRAVDRPGLIAGITLIDRSSLALATELCVAPPVTTRAKLSSGAP